MIDQATQAAQASAATMMRYDANKKSIGVSYLLWFFLGGLGAHRFYNGRTGSGRLSFESPSSSPASAPPLADMAKMDN